MRHHKTGQIGVTFAQQIILSGIQVVLEGEMVNLDVTSPAATVALALMYLKTNNENIASWFKIPRSSFELDYVCPDFILLRAVGRAIIMWDSIEPTEEWIKVCRCGPPIHRKCSHEMVIIAPVSKDTHYVIKSLQHRMV